MVRLRSALLAFLVALLWGTSFVLTKLALSEIGPFGIAFYRWLLATLSLMITLSVQGRLGEAYSAVHSAPASFLLLGFVGITAFYSLQNVALQFTTAINLGLIINLATVFTAVLALWWLKERLPPAALIGILLAFIGTLLIGTAQGGPTLTPQHIIGDLLTVAAAISAAVYTVYGKRVVAHYPPEIVTTVAAALGALFLLPFAAIEGLALPRTLVVWISLLVLGVGAGALANYWWWSLLERMDASRASVFLLLVPVVSTVTAILAIGESLSIQAAAGGLMVLVGLLLSQRK